MPHQKANEKEEHWIMKVLQRSSEWKQKERWSSFLMSGRHWSTHSRIVCHLGLAAAWHPSIFFFACVPNRPWSDQLFSSVQFNFDSLQLNFIYIASVTIKIASRHFTETQSLTSIEATVAGKTPSNKKKAMTEPASWRGREGRREGRKEGRRRGREWQEEEKKRCIIH